MNRRAMMQQCLTAGFLVVATRDSSTVHAADSTERKFTLDLCPGRIGVAAGQAEAIGYAAKYGFESVEPLGEQLEQLDVSKLEELRALMREKGVTWGAAGLPVDFRRDDRTFQDGLKSLPKIAKKLNLAEVTRVGTWISPGHNELTYLANFKQHANRLRVAANVLHDHGLRFGLEYVGPKTSWTSRRFPFIHTMTETKELIAEIGAENIGLILDSWHWYTAGEDLSHLDSLTNDDVVAVDLNDAPSGVVRDEQVDNRRELPLATGVIDLKGFLGSLMSMGYDGPVRAEPFNRKLNAMDDVAALQATSAAMKKAFALVE